MAGVAASGELIEWAAFRPTGSAAPRMVEDARELLYVCPCCVVVALPGLAVWGLARLCRRKTPVRTRWFIACCILAALTAAPAVTRIPPFGDRARDAAARDVIEQGRPVVQALLAYQKEHGAYPEDLQDLVPGHMATLPDTGLEAAREFDYSRYPDGSIELRVHVPEWFSQWTEIVHRPPGDYEEHYPDQLEPGRAWRDTTRVDDWAVVVVRS